MLIKNKHGVIAEKPIELVTEDDLVFDGDNWVHHDGVMYSGDKDVIAWDGITATPQHKVYVSDETWVTLEEAKEKRLSLWRGNISPYTGRPLQTEDATSGAQHKP